jgi:hypothetical protein
LISPEFVIRASQPIDRRNNMDTNIDFTDPDGPGIQPSVILNFLIKRCNEIIQSENPKVPGVLQGLGLSALGSDKELHDKYGKIISHSAHKKEALIRSSIDIFQSALEKDLDRRSSENPPRGEDWPEMGEKFCRHVMMRAIREGRQMLEEGDFRFVQVFVLLGWISLQSDSKRLAEFEATCHSFADDPEQILTRGRDVLKDALFLRRPQGQVQPVSE